LLRVKVLRTSMCLGPNVVRAVVCTGGQPLLERALSFCPRT
jgi:hypothetical protein